MNQLANIENTARTGADERGDETRQPLVIERVKELYEYPTLGVMPRWQVALDDALMDTFLDDHTAPEGELFSIIRYAMQDPAAAGLRLAELFAKHIEESTYIENHFDDLLTHLQLEDAA